LPEVLTTFNELMVEQGETENLKFLCYYHLIISTLSTSLISLDSFFVTDSDRRKSVIELEKIKNYYEKSLLIESQIKESNVIINTKKFKDRMKINYEFNNIINEFWGYNEIKKFYEHNKVIKNRMKKDINLQLNNDYCGEENFIDKESSDLEISNSLEFIKIDDDSLSYECNFDERFNIENSDQYLKKDNHSNSEYYKVNSVSNSSAGNITLNSSKKNKNKDKKYMTQSSTISLQSDKILKSNKKTINNKSSGKTKLKTKNNKKGTNSFDSNSMNELSSKNNTKNKNVLDQKHNEIKNNYIKQESHSTTSKSNFFYSATSNILENKSNSHSLLKTTPNSMSFTRSNNNMKIKNRKKENGLMLRKLN